MALTVDLLLSSGRRAGRERLHECPGSNERAFHLHRQLFRDVAEWLQFLCVRVDADQIPANENREEGNGFF